MIPIPKQLSSGAPVLYLAYKTCHPFFTFLSVFVFVFVVNFSRFVISYIIVSYIIKI